MSVATESTYTLADLKNWPAGVGNWSSDGTPLAVIGHPIAHSLSPVMHNAALADLAKTKPEFRKWRYFKFDIAPEELKEALDLFHKNGFRGLNLTVPHKAWVMPFLKLQDGFAQDAGAANTLKRIESGWHGYNTDGVGLSAALREDLAVDFKNANIVLLGAGGAARGAAVECINGGCASLSIGNRTPTTLRTLLINIKSSKAFTEPTRTTRLEEFDLARPFSSLPAESIVINATSLGLKSDDGSPIELTNIPRPSKVFDMIYRPPQTALLRQAAELGIPCANGLSMLVHQGAASLELWTGEKPSVKVMHAAVRTALN